MLTIYIYTVIIINTDANPHSCYGDVILILCPLHTARQMTNNSCILQPVPFSNLTVSVEGDKLRLLPGK